MTSWTTASFSNTKDFQQEKSKEFLEKCESQPFIRKKVYLETKGCWYNPNKKSLWCRMANFKWKILF